MSCPAFIIDPNERGQDAALNRVRASYHKWMDEKHPYPKKRMLCEEAEALLNFLTEHHADDLVEAIKVGPKVDIHDGDVAVLCETDWLCVYVLGWTSEMGVGWHDHGDADAIVKIVCGVVPNTVLRHGKPFTTLHHEGELLFLPAPGIHKMGFNHDRCDGVSIHAYTGPNCGLDTMRYFNEMADGCPDVANFTVWNRDREHPTE